MHPSNKFQRQLTSATKKEHAKAKKDRSGHVKRTLALQAVKEQELSNEIQEGQR